MMNGQNESSAKDRVVMASTFKAQCLGIIDRIAIDRVPVIITKRGRPVARLVPVDQEDAGRSMLGSVHLVAERDEDYYSTGEAWDELAG